MEFENNAVVNKASLPVTRGFVFVDVDNILYCEAEGVNTIFHMTDGSVKTLPKLLKEYECVLTNFGFIRIHSAFLVNAKKITEFKQPRSIILNDGRELKVAFRKKKAFLEKVCKIN